MPWLVRKVLRYASLSLQIAHGVTLSDNKTDGVTEKYGDINSTDGPVSTIHIKQSVNPGGFDSEGTYLVDGTAHRESLPIFGDVLMRLRYIKVEDVPDEELRRSLYDGTPSKIIIDEVAHNETRGWDARVFWGFEMIDGKRYFTRNVSTTKGKETVVCRIVYTHRG